MPSANEEVWRYSRIEQLDLDRFHPVPASAPAPAGLPAPAGELLAGLGSTSGLVTVKNGRLAGVTVDPGLTAAGVGFGRLADRRDISDIPATSAPDAIVEMNEAFSSEPISVVVPAGVVVDRPLVVVNWIDEAGLATFPRLSVEIGEAAQACVVEVLISEDVAIFVAPVAALWVADGGRLDYLHLQHLGPRAWQVGYQTSRIGRDASLRSFSAAFGGDYSRTRTDSSLVGQGGSTELLAAYFGDAAQMHDIRTLQDHDAPKTRSDLVFKGAVKDTSRSVYSGLIRIKRGAKGTDAFQTNRNLVLSEGAHADSVPNLEIDENDLACAHASAVGPIDPEQRYYLEARGVPAEEADRLIVLGFFDDLMDRLPVQSARSGLREAVAGKLAGVAG
jgi:Fe-S cluster assembly protein SufD